jgi:hypothetical protein
VLLAPLKCNDFEILRYYLWQAFWRMPGSFKNRLNATEQTQLTIPMKNIATQTLKTLLCATLLSGAAVTPVLAGSQGVLHSVNGSGAVHIPNDFFFPGSVSFWERYSISARQKADGTVDGTLIVEAWGESTPVSHSQSVIDITCLHTSGNTVYYGGVIRWSNDPFAAPGLEIVGIVTDADGADSDLTWFGPAFIFLAAGQDCSDEPAMPTLPLEVGNYVVR